MITPIDARDIFLLPTGNWQFRGLAEEVPPETSVIPFNTIEWQRFKRDNIDAEVAHD